MKIEGNRLEKVGTYGDVSRYERTGQGQVFDEIKRKGKSKSMKGWFRLVGRGQESQLAGGGHVWKWRGC